MEQKQYKKRIRLLCRIIIGLLLFGMIVSTITPVREYSTKENRSLAKRPHLSWESVSSGDFFSQYNAFFADQFPGRDLLMSLSSLGNRILGRKSFSETIMGKKGYIFDEPDRADPEAMTRTQSAINSFAASHPDLHISMLLVPDAATILDDKLPALTPVTDQVEEIASFQEGIEGVTKVDAASILKAHKDEYIYYKTDHHWTSDGAYAVFSEAAKDLGIEEDLYSYQSYVVSTSFQGTMASKSGKWSEEDTIRVYDPVKCDIKYFVYDPESGEKRASLFQEDMLKEKDQYTVFLGGNHALLDIRTTADSGKNLLILKDSYANCFVQFLYPYYSRIIVVDPRYYYENLDLAMTNYGITDVLILYYEDTLVSDTNLADVLASGTEEGE